MIFADFKIHCSMCGSQTSYAQVMFKPYNSSVSLCSKECYDRYDKAYARYILNKPQDIDLQVKDSKIYDCNGSL